jgi:hypothetical protein
MPCRVLLAAEASFDGVGLVRDAARQWAAGGVAGADLVGVVMVQRRRSLPRDVELQLRVVAGGVPYTWLLGHEKTWRDGVSVSPKLKSLISDLELLTERGN